MTFILTENQSHYELHTIQLKNDTNMETLEPTN